MKKTNKGAKIHLATITIQCLNCGKTSLKYPTKNYAEPRKYCCHKCSIEHKRIIRPNAGEKHYKWRGEEAHYSTHHSWIRNNYGKADKCINCNGKGLTYQWANISGEYKRDISDYMPLCRSCHGKYDHIRLYGDRCRRGHMRPLEEFRRSNDGGWKECRECRLLAYDKDRVRTRARRRELYKLNKEKKCPTN